MTDRLFPSALREVRRNLTSRPAIVGMLALGVILGVSGPFGTINVMAVAPRMFYWLMIVVLTYGIGSLVSEVMHRLLRNRSDVLVICLSTLALGLTLSIAIAAFNLAAFGIWFDNFTEVLVHLAQVTLIAAVVEICSHLLRKEPETIQAAPAPLLTRLPLDKRGALVALSAEDHYVRVTTTAGEELILLRLSDAMKEVGDTPGLQIHRSHWVALDQIANVTRTGDRGEATLSDQSTRPISRGYMPAVRAAGLLPQGRGG